MAEIAETHPKRFILTGAPGAGKTVLIRQLEFDGFTVVEEAATDLIALRLAQGVQEPHLHRHFIDDIVALQRLRLNSQRAPGVQFHDRSAVCTLALAEFLGRPVSPALASELARIEAEALYERRVFLIQNLGFVTPTAARRISFEDTLRFEAVHEQVYRRLGYDLVPIAVGSIVERARALTHLAVSFDAPAL